MGVETIADPCGGSCCGTVCMCPCTVFNITDTIKVTVSGFVGVAAPGGGYSSTVFTYYKEYTVNFGVDATPPMKCDAESVIPFEHNHYATLGTASDVDIDFELLGFVPCLAPLSEIAFTMRYAFDPVSGGSYPREDVTRYNTSAYRICYLDGSWYISAGDSYTDYDNPAYPYGVFFNTNVTFEPIP